MTNFRLFVSPQRNPAGALAAPPQALATTVCLCGFACSISGGGFYVRGIIQWGRGGGFDDGPLSLSSVHGF